MHRTTRAFLSRFLIAAFAFMLPTLVSAHTIPGVAIGFWYGMSHPLSGIDHMLAMLAIGMWAGQRGGRALWAIPLTFVGAMVIGGLIAMAGIVIPFVAQGIIISVLLAGIAVAVSARLPFVVSMLSIAFFGLLHGHAHGIEMPLAASALAYSIGFIFMTVLIQMSGIMIAVASQNKARSYATRFAGAGIALAGMVLFLFRIM